MSRRSVQTKTLQPPQPVAWTLVALVVLLFFILVAVLGAKAYQQVRHGGSIGLMAVEEPPARTMTPEAVAAPPSVPSITSSANAAASASASELTVRELSVEEQEVVTFNGRPLRAVRELTMKVTAYSPDARSCGKWADGNTASGYSVWTNGMKLVAADTDLLPFHSIVSIPGYNGDRPVPVLDRGGAIKGRRLDVLYPTHERALQWGVQELSVTVWEYAD